MSVYMQSTARTFINRWNDFQSKASANRNNSQSNFSSSYMDSLQHIATSKQALTNTTSTNAATNPHIVMFPLPIQGPVSCMIKLAELLLHVSPSNLSITFINTTFIDRLLSIHSNTKARLACSSQRFKFEVVSDGLGPAENPRGIHQLADVTNSLEAQARESDSQLRKLLALGTCVIADGLFGFLIDVAKEIRLPLVYIETISPCCLWIHLCLPKMVQAGELPIQDNNLDLQVKSVPGMESYLRGRDLPSFCRDYNPEDKVLQLILQQAHQFPKAQGLILNTFDELEGPYFSHMRAICPNIYIVGPLHLHQNTKIKPETQESSSNSLWQENRSCLAWLDAQPAKSVLFVSIGSLAIMTKDQLVELWHGLVNSKTRFLWVQRPGSVAEVDDEEGAKDLEAEELLEGTRQRGYIVNWVPQEEVLAHQAIGGFLTHSGWNSILESIVEGVPMICWPFFVDQQVNSRFVSTVWEIGIDMKDTCDRVVIEQMIKVLMEVKRDEFLTKADKISKLAKEAVSVNGSSHRSLNRLINDVMYMRFPIPSAAP